MVKNRPVIITIINRPSMCVRWVVLAYALIGVAVLLLAMLGAMDIGEFRFYYGWHKPPAEWCQP